MDTINRHSQICLMLPVLVMINTPLIDDFILCRQKRAMIDRRQRAVGPSADLLGGLAGSVFRRIKGANATLAAG